MIQTPRLLCHDRLVTSPFGLLGRGENVLTFALGYTFSKCPELLRHFLADSGVGGLKLNTLRSAEIRLQERAEDGITDIEISVPGKLFVVVEAKIGLSVPSLEQCMKYVPRFSAHGGARQRLVALVESPNSSFVQRYGAQRQELVPLLTAFHWSHLISACARLRPTCLASSDEGTWLRAFRRFLEQDYSMRAFTNEVWIVPANKTPLWPGGLSHYDVHSIRHVYYRKDHHAIRPLYIALRTGSFVTHVQRVLRVEHEALPEDLVPDLKNITSTWPREPHTIWVLGEPTPLPQPLPTGDPKMQARHAYCDFDVLISAPSVKDAVVKMKQRRRSP